MSLLSLSKPKLALACSAVGSCSAGVPFIYSAVKGRESQNIENPEMLTQREEVEVSQFDNKETKNVLASAETTQQEDTSLKNAQEFETLWEKIEKGYKDSQSDADRKNKGLSWKSEFQSIYNQEVKSDWKITTQKWKDCRAVGGQDAYCGYLELEKDSQKYRLRIDRYGRGEKEWDITVIKADDKKIKRYDNNQKTWVTENYEIQ